jgi:hypothetical protein
LGKWIDGWLQYKLQLEYNVLVEKNKIPVRFLLDVRFAAFEGG